MINDVNNLLLRERGAITKARPQQFYVCMYFNKGAKYLTKSVKVPYTEGDVLQMRVLLPSSAPDAPQLGLDCKELLGELVATTLLLLQPLLQLLKS